MRLYKAFAHKHTIPSVTLEATSLYEAKEKAVALFKPPKSQKHMVSVVLVDVPLSTGGI